jgi:hypothetical protein
MRETDFKVVNTERVGFEPTVLLSTLDFKSSAFDHSATSPLYGLIIIAENNPYWILMEFSCQQSEIPDNSMAHTREQKKNSAMLNPLNKRS